MISVIVPVYNCENYLSGCLDSILNQSFSDFECICINDGSSDNSLTILNLYSKMDDRIKVFSIENHGQAYARNYGIEASKGNLICFVDADDTVSPAYLEQLYSELMKNDSDLSVCGMSRVFKKKSNLLERNFNYYLTSSTKTAHVSQDPSLILSIINAPYCKLIRKDFLNQHQIRFLEGVIYEDLYFTQSLLMKNPRVSVLGQSLYQYFVYQGTTMTGKKSRHEDMYVVMECLLNQILNTEMAECVKEEIEYLVLHHVAIGTVYRAFVKCPLSLLKEVKKSRLFLKKYGFTIKNRYFYQASWIVQMYLRVFFSFL